MPWKETCVMDEKTAFIAECLRGELPMTALCERYGISRDTGYRLLRRYREEGPGGLEPRVRRRRATPQRRVRSRRDPTIRTRPGRGPKTPPRPKWVRLVNYRFGGAP